MRAHTHTLTKRTNEMQYNEWMTKKKKRQTKTKPKTGWLLTFAYVQRLHILHCMLLGLVVFRFYCRCHLFEMQLID